MSPLLAVVVTIGLIWLVGSFYWTRVLTGLVLLSLWGLVSVAFPIYLVLSALGKGNVVFAVVTVAVSALSGILWWQCVGFARRWYESEERFGTFWKPWHSR